ncbi:MAG TPA: two-component regulator propeller domain-containing protein, partial [Chitinophagaceae bacterium]|nr:two-component regulator propeller domain-containing protein [Chitinophagaceae bacterium]
MLILKQILIFTKQVLFPFSFILILAYPARGQQVTFNHVSQPESSISGIINGITQDSLGYMWFAVYNRLYRSDGYQLVVYQNDPKDSTSLASNAIETVYADHNGIIWIGTQQSGLDRFDPCTGIFTHFRSKTNDNASLSDDRVTAVLEDHEGTLWVGTVNGLNRMDQKTGTFTRFMHNTND